MHAFAKNHVGMNAVFDFGIYFLQNLTAFVGPFMILHELPMIPLETNVKRINVNASDMTLYENDTYLPHSNGS